MSPISSQTPSLSKLRPDSENKLDESEYSAFRIKGGAAPEPLMKEEFISSGTPITFIDGFI
jgi:hypothetical protein